MNRSRTTHHYFIEIEVSPGNGCTQSSIELTNAALSGISGKMKLK